jgi:hypothetical protein
MTGSGFLQFPVDHPITVPIQIAGTVIVLSPDLFRPTDGAGAARTAQMDGAWSVQK